jgi:hypothetical protein
VAIARAASGEGIDLEIRLLMLGTSANCKT